VIGVNKNTVTRALHILRDEGLLDFTRGRGIRVVASPSKSIFKHESMIFWTMHAGRDTEAKKLLRSSSLKFESSNSALRIAIDELHPMEYGFSSKAEANNRLETEDVGTALEGKSSRLHPCRELSRVVTMAGMGCTLLPRFGDVPTQAPLEICKRCDVGDGARRTFGCSKSEVASRTMPRRSITSTTSHCLAW